MEFIRTLREKHQTAKQTNIEQQAVNHITLDDFNDSIFIAFNGVPFVPIDKSWTTKEIINKLSELRQNYVNAKMQETQARI